MKVGQKQTKQSILNLVLILSIIFSGSALFEIAKPDTASAATFKELSIEEKAKAWVMGRAVSECINERGFEDGNKSGSDVNDGEWLNGQVGYDDPVDIGEWAADIAEGDSNNSKAKCVTVARKALELIGISGTEALCKMNELAGKELWERGSGDCRNGTGDYDYEEDNGKNNTDIWNNLFRQWLGGNVESSLTPGMRYIIYSENFYQECSKDNGSGWNTPREWKDGDKEGGKVYKLKWNKKGTTPDKEWYVVSGGNDNGHDVHIDGYGMLTGDDKLQCKSLAERINGNASAYLAEVAKSTNPDDTVTAEPIEVNSDESATSCAVDGVGWMVCPVMKFLGEINDKAFGFLQGLLGIRPSLLQDDATVAAWSSFRDLANVAFVIAFLVIIYSQITSFGVSNYGIKKLLPKIAVAAILVNLSLFLCQILVDASNIAGASLYSFIEGIVPPLKGTAQEAGWGTSAVLLLGAGIGIGLIVFLGAAPAVLLALFLVLFILIARQAFILILVIISPLAFVAYLLPNTEGMFKKWWKALSATLLVYPIIGVVFGASTLASNILMGIASDNGNVEQAAMTEDNQLLAIVALAVMAIPLFAIPLILKGAMSSAGAIGAKLSSLQDRANNKASGQIKERSGQEFNSLKNGVGSRLLSSDSRRARAAAFLTGTRRKANRESRYKDNESLRGAAEEAFVHREGSKTADRKGRVVEAQETADLRKKIVQDDAKLQHLNNNHELHNSAINSGLNLHNAEETHKNDAGAAHMVANTGQYDDLNRSRGVKQNTELDATRRFEGSAVGQDLGVARQGLEDQVATEKGRQSETYKTSADGRTNSQARKGVEGRVKIADQTNELSFQRSQEGQAQSQSLEGVEGALQIVRDDQKLEFSSSGIGQAQAQTKKVIQGQQKVVDGGVDLRYESSSEGRSANINNAVVQTQLGAVKGATDAEIQELKAGVTANGFDDPTSPNYIADTSDPKYEAARDLSLADIETRAQSQRAATGANEANVEYARAIRGSANGSDGGVLIDTAQGIGGTAARTRAVAAASQTIDKQLTEAIQTQKSNQESHDPDRLFATMMDESLPAERRAAAAGLIMSRGGDQHVEEVLDYLGTAVPTSTDQVDALQAMQKQVSADIGNRKPQGLGRTDLSRLTQGSFGAANVQRDNDGNIITDPTTGRPLFNPGARQVSFEDSLIGRVNGGKIGTEQLAKMGADELARLAHAVETRGNEMDGDMYLNLQKSITALNEDTNLKAAVDTPEQQALLQNILNGAGVNGAIGLQNLEYTRTRQPRQTL